MRWHSLLSPNIAKEEIDEQSKYTPIICRFQPAITLILSFMAYVERVIMQFLSAQCTIDNLCYLYHYYLYSTIDFGQLVCTNTDYKGCNFGNCLCDR